ncbi:MAG: hypothetical protein QXK69_04420 [Candidatus Caldarchaeum sp.]
MTKNWAKAVRSIGTVNLRSMGWVFPFVGVDRVGVGLGRLMVEVSFPVSGHLRG